MGEDIVYRRRESALVAIWKSHRPESRPGSSLVTNDHQDQLNGTLILDNYEDDRFMALAPHTGVIDIAVPRKISSNVTIPAPAASTIGNWIRAARTA